MYKVKYEKYRYGYGGTQEVKIFYSLEEIADWLFGMVKLQFVLLVKQRKSESCLLK